MQRRAGRKAYISPPSSFDDMSSDDDKSSKMNSRNGRIWFLVALFLAILGLTHFVLPNAQNYYSNHTPYTPTNLKPINYLNASSEPNPFPFCPLYGPGDELAKKYGTLSLEQSRLHLGSGARVQRVIQKALAGQPVTISVLGGSVSACHGSGDDPISQSCYPSLFFKWWNSIFPHPATELTNGALRRTNSEYFGYCSAHHIPDVTDLVIVELDADDASTRDAVTHFEVLIRTLLLRPDKPAVIVLGHYSPQMHEAFGFAGPDHWHNVVAQFYDVPHISIKQTLLSHLLTSPKELNPYFADAVLASPLGHQLLADKLVAYLQSQICQTWTSLTSPVPLLAVSNNPLDPSENHGLFGGVGQRKGVPPEDKKNAAGNQKAGWKLEGENVDADGMPNGPNLALNGEKGKQVVPPGLVATSSSSSHFEEIVPYCASANDLINPLPPSLFYGSGWFAYHPPPNSANAALAVQTSMTHYWYSTLPTSKLRVPVELARGDVGVYYVKEPISDIGEGSSVECWVDDNYAGAVVLEGSGDVSEPVPVLDMIDHNVAKGSHYIECQLLGEEGTGVPTFKIIGVFAT